MRSSSGYLPGHALGFLRGGLALCLVDEVIQYVFGLVQGRRTTTGS